MARHEVVLGGGLPWLALPYSKSSLCGATGDCTKGSARTAYVNEQHLAFVDLVQAGRRVQRVLVDLELDPSSTSLQERLGQDLDRLTESVATVRLVVTDGDVVAAAEAFEDKAKELERKREWGREDTLRLSPLISVLQKAEAQPAH